jgi:hypothetical protein
MPFQPSTFTINGSMHITALHESGTLPENIIKVSDAFHIHVDLNLNGNISVLGGDKIVLEAMMESMGIGFEGTVGTATLTFPNPLTSPFNTNIIINCGTPAADGITPGVYKLMVLATVQTAGGTPVGIVGFDEGPFVQVYDGP